MTYQLYSPAYYLIFNNKLANLNWILRHENPEYGLFGCSGLSQVCPVKTLQSHEEPSSSYLRRILFKAYPHDLILRIKADITWSDTTLSSILESCSILSRWFYWQYLKLIWYKYLGSHLIIISRSRLRCYCSAWRNGIVAQTF